MSNCDGAETVWMAHRSNVRTSWPQNHRLKEGLPIRSPANITQVFKLLLQHWFISFKLIMMSCYKVRYVTVWSEQQHHLHQQRSTGVIKALVIITLVYFYLSQNISTCGFASSLTKSNHIFYRSTFHDRWTNNSHNYWLQQNHHLTKQSQS